MQLADAKTPLQTAAIDVYLKLPERSRWVASVGIGTASRRSRPPERWYREPLFRSAGHEDSHGLSPSRYWLQSHR